MPALDYLLVNARIADPESGRDFRGGLGIAGTRIAGVYPEGSALPQAVRVLDLAGNLLAPGFIDVHSHTDNDVRCAEKLLAQGVTTVFSGNCGLSPVDFPAFFAGFEARGGYPLNQAEQIGHTALREASGLRDVYAPASRSQLNTMLDLLEQALAAGAAGLSFGLEYTPGASASEVRELVRLTAKARRIVSIHLRLTPHDPLDALREALDLVPATGVRLIVSHLVYMYTGEHLKAAVNLIREYRERSVEVWVDSGMYTAFTTGVGTPLFEERVFFERGLRLENLRAATGKYAGQVLGLEQFREMRRDFPHDNIIYEAGSPEDIWTAYSLPEVMVSTDAGITPPGQGHPQGAATYPYFFRVMVREQRRLSLLDGLRRCTLFPAQALGYERKGRLSPGADADLAALDWERLREGASFLGSGPGPDAPPEGVTHVFVNGALAIENGRRLSGVNAGDYLR